jgi:hypothetical protein
VDLKEYYYFLTERGCDVSIAAGLISYVIGTLNLNMFSAQIFILCCYIGTFLTMGGFLAKLGMFPTEMKSKRSLSFLLLFTSAMLFTTAVILPFVDLTMSAEWRRPLWISENFHYTDAMGNSVYAYRPPSNVRFTVNQPYIWLIGPVIVVGAVLFVIAVIIWYID